MPDHAFYALGLDGAKRRIDAVTSNPGHALWAGIVAPARAPLLARRLLSDDLFSGWGVRTLSARASAYNPLGYHLGTVWPHDNSLIVAGLRRYGHDDEADRLVTAVFEAALQFPYFRLPELFSGIARNEYAVPIGYPVACSPQAWAAGSLPFMLSQMLGLQPRQGGRALELVRPRLPAHLQQARLRGLRVGQTRLDLVFTQAGRSGESAQVTVERMEGDIEVRLSDAVDGGKSTATTPPSSSR
jgi:glycogen debranching enzyme